MSTHVVCHECRHPDRRPGPRTWRYPCSECAEQFAGYHRDDTGHDKVEVRIVEEITTEELTAMIRRVG